MKYLIEHNKHIQVSDVLHGHNRANQMAFCSPFPALLQIAAARRTYKEHNYTYK